MLESVSSHLKWRFLFSSAHHIVCSDVPIVAAAVVCFNFLIFNRFTVNQLVTLRLVQHQPLFCVTWEILDVEMERGRLSWRLTATRYSENHKVSELGFTDVKKDQHSISRWEISTKKKKTSFTSTYGCLCVFDAILDRFVPFRFFWPLLI